ncbi:glycosyltransferase family 4 protein [Calothrix sp. CCY 0018]|uniref:glycosyltransferase family 4 protein n=1 Tax=Calothrix sp. CCY 0018 TaxID=3103864 RepID=UPI0039C6E8BF
MKIAVIGAKGLPPKQGGIEHYCAEVYPRMVARGHKVDLFARSSYTDTPYSNRYESNGVKVISLSGGKIRGIDALITSMEGAAIAAANKYDIVHFHALGPSLFTCLPRIASSAKIVVTCHGLDWQRAKWGNFSTRLIKTGEKAAVKFAHTIVVVSEALQDYFWQTYNRETIYIPNAPASYSDSNSNFSYGASLGLTKNKYILFLGRLVPEKRPELLLEAFEALKLTGWKLVLAGGISDARAFSAELLQKVAANPHIVYAGELRGSRLAEIVRGAGLFSLPSDVEGMPLVMLEAMREGIPVLASDIPPHRQLLAQHRGILFEAGNIDSCIRSLEWAINNHTEITLRAIKAQKYVMLNYSWERITSDNLNLYSKMLNIPNSLDRLQSSSDKLEKIYMKNR